MLLFRRPLPIITICIASLWFVPAHAAVAATSTPAPAATTESCPANRDAIVKNAMSPDYPDAARDLGLGPVTVVVDVSVSPNGSITGLRLAESSNNSAIDVAAMDAALKSTYTPKIVACEPVPGHYLFRAEFNPD